MNLQKTLYTSLFLIIFTLLNFGSSFAKEFFMVCQLERNHKKFDFYVEEDKEGNIQSSGQIFLTDLLDQEPYFVPIIRDQTVQIKAISFTTNPKGYPLISHVKISLDDQNQFELKLREDIPFSGRHEEEGTFFFRVISEQFNLIDEDLVTCRGGSSTPKPAFSGSN